MWSPSSSRTVFSARAAALALAVAAALGAASAARADGDPASDYLLGQQVFLPFGVNISPPLAEQLTALTSDAAKRGYPIRVAVIAKPLDLGAVTPLWGRPQEYARFLAAEIAFAYRGRLLVVMPQGLGFHSTKHTRAEARALTGVPISDGANGLISTAITAVKRLAATHGVQLQAPTTVMPRRKHGLDRRKLGLIAGIVCVVGVAAVLPILRLRRRKADPS